MFKHLSNIAKMFKHLILCRAFFLNIVPYATFCGSRTKPFNLQQTYLQLGHDGDLTMKSLNYAMGSNINIMPLIWHFDMHAVFCVFACAYDIKLVSYHVSWKQFRA